MPATRPPGGTRRFWPNTSVEANSARNTNRRITVGFGDLTNTKECLLFKVRLRRRQTCGSRSSIAGKMPAVRTQDACAPIESRDDELRPQPWTWILCELPRPTGVD